jgi:thiol:disulfide interchange protein DsbD
MGDFKFNLNTNKALSINSIDLAVRYQLCNDITHVCFRPQTAQVQLNLPVSTSVDTNNSELSFTDKLLGLFKSNQDNTLLIFALMFLAGLLSVATPCVYPMLPITSMFIVNRANGEAKKEKQHAFVYLIGIIGTYMLLGLIAGMTGGAFNTFMQSAWVNLAFALFFAFFAIALLGFYELSFMQSEVHSLDQQTSRVKGLTGTWLMGTVAGLVISPCVGPIVFALLLQVADNIANQAAALAAVNQSLSGWQRFVISAQGSVMMAGFGLGVGLPFFIISVVKFKLPRAGFWMNKIKVGFGLVILYFAYSYLAKGMGVLGVSASVTLSLAMGLAAVWAAVIHLNVLSSLAADAPANEKMHRFLGVVTLLIGAWLLISSLSHTPLLAAAQANIPATATATACSSDNQKTASIEQDAGISWYRNYEAAQQQAKQTGKPIFIDFYASWCANCLAFKAEAASNAQLNQALREKAIAVKLVDQEPEFEKFRENPEHRALKIGLPYFAILSPEGRLLWSSTDYTATQQMIAVLSNGAV